MLSGGDGGAFVIPQNEAATSLQSAYCRAPVEKWLPEGSENAGASAKRGAAPDKEG